MTNKHTPFLLSLVLSAVATFVDQATVHASAQEPAFQPIEFSFDFSDVLVDLDSNTATPSVTLGSLGTGPKYGLSEEFNGVLAAGQPNPFVHFRFTALVSSPNPTIVYPIPGFFAAAGGSGDPCTGDIDPGCVWKFRFTPDERIGTWNYTVVLDAGDGASFGYASYPTQGGTDLVPANLSIKPVDISGPITPRGVLARRSVTLLTVGVDPQGNGFYSKGFLRVDKTAATGTTHYRFSRVGLSDDDRYFIKLGVNSPENLFGYREFYKSLKDPVGLEPRVHPWAPNPPPVFPGTGAWHQYDAEEAGVTAQLGLEVTHARYDWVQGLPEWVTTGFEMLRSHAAPVTSITVLSRYYNDGSAGCQSTPPFLGWQGMA